MKSAVTRGLRAFWHRAYRENITGLSGMVAFNLLLSVFPFALLVLFLFGTVLKSGHIEDSVLRDLTELFPDTEQDSLQDALDRVRNNATEAGIVALVAGVWIGASFWGAMDTAFCRIYHVRCRSWVEQKRFSLGMLVVVMLLLAASVAIPAVQSGVQSSVDDLPLGLSDFHALDNLLFLIGAGIISFGIFALIYWAVPKGHVPWPGVWPGALFTTLAIALASWIFPLYLLNISTIGEFGRIVSFVLVALVWFYFLALSILAGAVINALRHELRATGTVAGMTREFGVVQPSADSEEEDCGCGEPPNQAPQP